MRTMDKILSRVVLGALAPISLLLGFWWGSIPFTADPNRVAVLSFFGLLLGVFLDLTILRRFVARLYELSLPALLAVETFYAVMVYEFFMGLPVVNTAVGILGSYIVARSGSVRGADAAETRSRLKTLRIYSFLLLLAFCFASAVLALREETIGSQVRGMLNLPFEVTPGMVWTLIVAGGILLLAAQHFLSRLVGSRTLQSAAIRKT